MKRLLVVPLLLYISLLSKGLMAQGNTIEKMGDIALFTLPAVSLGASLFENDGTGTWQFTKGFVLNQAVTFGLKLAINKERPNMQNNNAFPSGHTSTTFQSAAFIQKRYGWKWGIPAYVIAGFTGYSRIAADKHDGWDILAGALLGVGSSYLFTSPYQQEKFGVSITGNRDSVHIVLNLKF